ncbi:hypothetical protein B9G54_02390 [Alloscardovia macacae]|uniref:Esterase n=2 Tax=Alloscardovia macacae TaxID=1160091 RepID=A0A1Y2SZ62_9BIFI|nr:hypothetical protein B9G54_02390 [Alloscardovia macacae]OTA29699.1 hypothetical protein B9T39_02365 [Alloscardovia macacae]
MNASPVYQIYQWLSDMNTWWLNTHIDGGWVMWGSMGIVAVLVLSLLPLRMGVYRPSARVSRSVPLRSVSPTASRSVSPYHAFLRQFFWTIVAGAVGWAIAWLLSDVIVAFGVSLGRKITLRVALGSALIGFALVSVRIHRSWRRVLAVLLVPAAILLSALQINAVYGQYPTVRTLLGVEHFERASSFPVANSSLTDYLSSSSSVPSRGRINSVDIPATTSHFQARTAVVYLPPAVLGKKVPDMPVLLVLSGQPGNPDTFFTAGQIGALADAYAKTHHGLAPVIVSPDQLGARFHNTLCANTRPYGNAETYLTQDVIRWIESTLPVTKDHTKWGLAGFSQGGTCSVQLGPTYPQLFSHIIDVSGELSPNAGSESTMIQDYFGGDKAVYEAHIPQNAFAKYASSSFASTEIPQHTIILAAGELDPLAQRNEVAISRFAEKAGWSVSSVLAKKSGHDWQTVRAVMRYGLDIFGYETGLSSSVEAKLGGQILNKPKLSDYPDLQPLPGAAQTQNPQKEVR